MAILDQKRTLNLIPGISAPVTIHVSQGDVGTTIQFTLVKGDEVFVNPGNVIAYMHGTREDGGQFGVYECAISGNTVSFTLKQEMTAVKGSAVAEITLEDSSGNKVGSANFAVLVEKSVFPAGVTYDNDVSVYESILRYVAQLPASFAGNISSLQAQIDEIIAPSGEAPSAAEVQNARISADNITYMTLGNAIRNQVGNARSALDMFGATLEIEGLITYTRGGVTFTRDGQTIHASGNSTSVIAFCNIYMINIPSHDIKGGDTVYFSWESDDKSKLYPEAYFYRSGESSAYNVLYSDGIPSCFRIDNDCAILLIRIRAKSNTSINNSITLNLQKFPLAQYLFKGDEMTFGMSGETIDLNTVLDTGLFIMHDAATYLHEPYERAIGFLLSAYTENWRLQIFFAFSGGRMYKRRGSKDGSAWESWWMITGSGGTTYNITNNYTFPEYSQSVTLNASPSITADTNDYLAPTGDSSDRTADILAMLSSTGICRLGAGTYYVKDLAMPAGSMLVGSGYATEVHMLGTDDGFAVKLGNYCTVKDLRLVGAESELSFGETEGGRHGILWQGTYSQNRSAPIMGRVSGVHIHRFSGGGIRCYDTGYGTGNGLEVSDVYARNCWAGIDIAYWSEFHKFTNVKSGYCRIGCVNNGGNNIFVNCDFSSNQEIAMLFDNSQGQSPNNTHGSCIGCVFNHTAHDGMSNSGIGIKMLNCHSGFVFSGCQIFYSQIYIENSDGVTVSDAIMGYVNCDITISGGGTVIFSNCQGEGTIPINISSNNNVHIVNCYNKATGVPWIL